MAAQWLPFDILTFDIQQCNCQNGPFSVNNALNNVYTTEIILKMG